ncbi:MAG: acetyltransferase, family [Labilithrix sp.]|nr:acetyltransferase, family [Labilithrix sp.]
MAKPMNEALRFRPATAADLDRVVEIHVAAFPDARGALERRRNFTHSLHGALEDLVLALRGDEIVGQAFLFPMTGWFGGRAVQMGGIASVSIAVEARGQGVATALLRGLHVASDMRGDALTMLHAFREGFYARLGYGKTASRRRLVFDPSSVPAAWRALARERVRRPRGEDREGISAAYARHATRSTGWLTRDEHLWERHLAHERRHYLVVDRPPSEGGGLAGYVAFQIRQTEPHASMSAVVEELAADDDASRRALIGALGAMRDQLTEIVLEVDGRDPLEHALLDADARRFGTNDVEHTLGTVVAGPLVRIEDVPRAIESRGYQAEGVFDLVVRGDAGEEQAATVRVSGGHAEVSSVRGATTGALRTSRATLASLLYGGLRATDAVRLGLADADPRVLARADAILAIAPPLPVDPF